MFIKIAHYLLNYFLIELIVNFVPSRGHVLCCKKKTHAQTLYNYYINCEYLSLEYMIEGDLLCSLLFN